MSRVLEKHIDERCESMKLQLSESLNKQLECRVSDITNNIINEVEKQITEQYSIVNTIVEKQISAVSYTHLDVYKRQSDHSTVVKAEAISGKK